MSLASVAESKILGTPSVTRDSVLLSGAIAGAATLLVTGLWKLLS